MGENLIQLIPFRPVCVEFSHRPQRLIHSLMWLTSLYRNSSLIRSHFRDKSELQICIGVRGKANLLWSMSPYLFFPFFSRLDHSLARLSSRSCFFNLFIYFMWVHCFCSNRWKRWLGNGWSAPFFGGGGHLKQNMYFHAENTATATSSKPQLLHFFIR